MKHITKLFTASFAVVLMGQSVLGATQDEQDDIIDKAINKKGAKKEGVVEVLHLEKVPNNRGTGKISDDGLRRLANRKELKQLKRLFLSGTKITDLGLGPVGKNLLQLKRLTLKGCDGITDAGLQHLHGLDHLIELRLKGTKVTAAGVTKLEKALSNGIRITHDFKE